MEAGGDAALVVGFDRSPASTAALSKAAELGTRLCASIHVVHAVDLFDHPVDPDSEDWEHQAARSLDGERGAAAEVLAGYPCDWSYRTVRAEPAEALNALAEQLDALMIIVGARAPGWRHLVERLASPSLAHRLMNHTHRPVLVVSEPP